MALFLLLTTSLMIAGAAPVLGLNRPSEGTDSFERPEPSWQAGQKEIQDAWPPASKPPVPANGAKKITKAQATKLRDLQPKILILFKILEICDHDHFDIQAIQLPDSWSAQSRAMMALANTKKRNLIRKADLNRYRRIMHNCNLISKLVEERKERKASLESEMSGVSSYDLDEMRGQMEKSPLEDLRQRFSALTVVDKPELVQTTSPSREAPDRSAPPETGKTTRPFVMQLLEGPVTPRENPPTLIQFL